MKNIWYIWFFGFLLIVGALIGSQVILNYTVLFWGLMLLTFMLGVCYVFRKEIVQAYKDLS
jgi:hypothetical protein